jgi:hypothetical protein
MHTVIEYAIRSSFTKHYEHNVLKSTVNQSTANLIYSLRYSISNEVLHHVKICMNCLY